MITSLVGMNVCALMQISVCVCLVGMNVCALM